MGDTAERIFEEVHQNKWVRFGFNRPPFRMTHLSSFVRHTPDYCDRFGLWDCMGLGRDGILKLKLEKFEALAEWNNHQPTGLFVWNSHLREYAYIRFDDLATLVSGQNVRRFNDGNQYWPIEWDRVEGKQAYDE